MITQEESSTPSSSPSSFSSSCLQVFSCQGVKSHFNFNNSWQGEPCTRGPGAWKLYKPLVQQDNGDHDAQQLLLQQQQGEGGSQKLNGQLPFHGGDVARSPFPTPNTPFSQDPGIPVDLPEGSGMAEFVANMLRWWRQDSLAILDHSILSPALTLFWGWRSTKEMVPTRQIQCRTNQVPGNALATIVGTTHTTH